MRRTIIILMALVAGFIPAVEAKDSFIKEFPVKPGTCYRLSFKADASVEGATWLLRIRNRQGELPYDGAYERQWQQITPDKVLYTQSFQTKPEAATLWFGIRSEGAPPKISEVTLEPITPANILINGDFSAGKDNYSGWTEHFNTSFVEKDGKPVLKVEHNGYVLSDPILVAGGGEYKYAPKSVRATSILVCDSGMHLIKVIPNNQSIGAFKMPEAATYVRLLYQTWYDHHPSLRTKIITSVGLVQIDAPKHVKVDVPRFPGEIILDALCDAREENAARELQHWIQEITGKRIPVLAAASESANTKIYLGAKWAGKYTDDLKYLADSDGYAVRRDGKNIYVFGANPRGSLFGVYALLEKNTDIIWPRPNPEFIAVFSKAPTIEFADSNFRSRPAFKFRQINIMGGERNPNLAQDWIGRNGGNQPMVMGKGFQYLRWRSGATIGVGGGYIWTFLGLDQEDEELYPLVNGNRLRNMWRQPCYTHPGVPKAMAKTAREMLASVPGKEVEYLIARVGDNWEVCGCPNCMAPIKLADGTLLKPKATTSGKDPLFFSTRNYMMLNAFAEEMVKDYPDLKIHTHAYIFAAEPPKVKLHPAIVPHFAAYPTKDERYPILSQPTDRGEIWGRRFRQWGREQDVQFGFFGYYYTDGFNALADTAGPDYKALADMRGLQVHTEGFPPDTDRPNRWDVDGPEKWAIAKLQWDPYQDPAALREEYIQRTYKDAAPKMREFYQLINNSWHDKANTTSVNCHSSAKILFQKFIVDAGIESSARTLLDEAQKTATNPLSRKMIQRTLARFDAYAEGLNRMIIPFVPESTEQWDDSTSPHWYKAISVGDFTRVNTWQPLPEDKLATHKTTVSIMRDKENIYFKIDAFVDEPLSAKPISRKDAFPQDDRAEIVLRSGRDTYYIAVGADGGTYLLKNFNTALPWKNHLKVKYLHLDKNWTALIAIPMSDIELNPAELDLDGKYCRVFAPKSPDREESTYGGRGIFNNDESLRSPLQFEK